MFDDASPFGLAVTALYGIAAWRCIVAARRRSPGRTDGFWGPCAIALLALGLNKQLDAQTTLIRVLRTLSREGGWYGVRRAVEAAGFALLLLASLGAAALAWRRRKRWRRDGARPWAMAGFGLLALYVLLRAGDILHVGRQAPALIETAHALIEPAGLLLVLAGAARDQARRGNQPSST